MVFSCSPNKEQISLKQNVCLCISFPFSLLEVASGGSEGSRDTSQEKTGHRRQKPPQDKAGAEWGVLSAPPAGARRMEPKQGTSVAPASGAG